MEKLPQVYKTEDNLEGGGDGRRKICVLLWARDKQVSRADKQQQTWNEICSRTFDPHCIGDKHPTVVQNVEKEKKKKNKE